MDEASLSRIPVKGFLGCPLLVGGFTASLIRCENCADLWMPKWWGLLCVYSLHSNKLIFNLDLLYSNEIW